MNNEEFDFDSEFSTDEEVENMFDSIAAAINKNGAANNSSMSIVNPRRMQEFLYTYKILKYLTKGTKSKVTYDMYTLCRSAGCVSVVGSNILFKNVERFLKAAELATNFEVYPKTDGMVQMNFTFHGLTKQVD